MAKVKSELQIPTFTSEAEEADWWFANQNAVAEEFVHAAQEGTLKRGTPGRGATPTTTIRLDPTDIELAKEQAAARGLRYQTYLKMLIHTALRDEAKSVKRSA